MTGPADSVRAGCELTERHHGAAGQGVKEPGVGVVGEAPLGERKDRARPDRLGHALTVPAPRWGSIGVTLVDGCDAFDSSS